MNELVICSGKGGTGKTSVTAALAALAAPENNFVLADCDVDAANLHLVARPQVVESHEFIAGRIAEIRPDDCGDCGVCASQCRFDAIDVVEGRHRINALACEGCGVCVHFCPDQAIDFPERRCGEWRLSETAFGPMVHARLDVGAENSGKLVSLVREQARRQAEKLGMDLVLVDGPPGIGCPVTAALTGADLTLLVTEPSLSGLHDLKRIAQLAAHFRVPALVCINKYDLSPELTAQVEDYCRQEGLPLIGRIPFEPMVNEAQAAGRSLVEQAPHTAAAHELVTIWHRIEHRLAQAAPKG